MLSFFRKNKSKQPSQSQNQNQEELVQQPLLTRPKTRSQTKQSINQVQQQPQPQPISEPIKSHSNHQNQINKQQETTNHQINQLVNQSESNSVVQNQTIILPPPSIEVKDHHFRLNDIQDIRSYFHYYSNQQQQQQQQQQQPPLSLYEFLNLISKSQSNQSNQSQSNLQHKLSIQLQPINHHPPQSTINHDSVLLNPIQSLNHHTHSSNQTLKGKGKRTIEEEEEEEEEDLQSDLISDYELINPSSPSNPNPNPNPILSSHQPKVNHTTPTKKIKIDKSHDHRPKFDLLQLSSSTYYNQLLKPTVPELFHGLSIELWNQVFNHVNQHSIQQTINTQNLSKPSHQDLNPSFINHLIRSQYQSHQYQLISKTLLPSTRSTAWSFLVLNNFQRIQSVTRLLESNSSLTQLIKTCYIILPTTTIHQTPAKPSNRQSMIVLDDPKKTPAKDENVPLPMRSRSSTLLTPLATGNPSGKPNPLYTNQRRQESKTPISKKNLNVLQATPQPDSSDQSTLYIQEIPSLLFSLSTNLQEFYLIGPAPICTKVLRSLSNLSHHLSALQSLTIIGGGDHHGFFGLLNGLSGLPNPCGLRKLVVTGPQGLVIGSKSCGALRRSVSSAGTKKASDQLLGLDEIWLGNGLALSVGEVRELGLKLRPNSLKSLKLCISLDHLNAKGGEGRVNGELNEVFKRCANSLEHLSLEEDWFTSSSSSSTTTNPQREGEKEEMMVLDEALMNLNRLNSLDLSGIKSDWVSERLWNVLPISLESVKLWDPSVKVLKGLANGPCSVRRVEVFGCRRRGMEGLERLRRAGIEVVFR